ncbi:MAG: sterol desaturase family protein [Myxococcota bacterium]
MNPPTDLPLLVNGNPVVIDSLELLGGLLVLVGAPIFIVELASLYRSGQLTVRRLGGILTSLFTLLPATAVQVVLGRVLVTLFFAVHALAPWPIPTTWATAALALLAVDFVYYWDHRLSHEVNVMWSAYHSVHHSADHFDQSIAARISFVDIVSVVLYFPLALLGLHPLLILGCYGVVLGWQQWIHTELIDRLPMLDGWLNTPSNHRVHHARNPEYLDRNYGGILMVWDRLFGTYSAENIPVDYGLVTPQTSQHPWTVHFFSLKMLVQRLKRSPSLSDVLRVLLGRPADAKR